MKEIRIDFPVVGNLSERPNPVRKSMFTLGCEVLDRDFADYEQYKEYIAPLGIPVIRLQAGWAKCEKVRGVYDFRWLDTIIDDALSRGLQILLETDYGNPVYPGGGGRDLAGGFPSSEEGLAAWDNWVRAIAEHFKGRVRDWAMWNEPDIANPTPSGETIVKFNLRTANIIRQVIPDARIAGLSLAGSAGMLEACAKYMQDSGNTHIFDWIIYHGYKYNPDEACDQGKKYAAVLKEYGIHAILRQGENGCPSEKTTCFALKDYEWSEFSQSKWDLRRFIGDIGNGFETSVFTICDFNHIGREINRKGLLYANEDHKVLRKKQAYDAIRNMTTVFDSSWTPVRGTGALICGTDSSFYTFRKADGEHFAVYWDRSGTPDDREETAFCDIILKNVAFRHPVLADLISGRLYEIPAVLAEQHKELLLFRNMPFTDSPLVLMEKP